SEYGKNRDAQIACQAFSLFCRQLTGKGAAVEKLRHLSKEDPDNPDVTFYLGKAYEDYNDFWKAAEHYEKAADQVPNDRERLARLCNAAIAKRKAGCSNVEGWLLDRTKAIICKAENGEYTLLSTLRELAELNGEDDKYIAYTESMLGLRHDDHDLRFKLAYKYSDLKNNELALYHYTLIPIKERNSTIWNNIGVAFARLELKGRAINAYRKSEELGGTLAISNLAHGYIGAGFLGDAEDMCNRATKIEEYDKQVGTAITSIKETREREDKTRDEIIERSEIKKMYFVDFGQACISDLSGDCEGTWTAPECDLRVMVEGKRFIAQGKYEKEEVGFGLGAALLGTTSGVGAKPKKKTIVVEYEGEITGRSVQYKRVTTGESALPSLLAGTNGVEGLMIINGECSEISVYQKGTKESEKFYKITRVV
ncbi:hypothetical protein JYT87_03255, partial [Nitrospira defluvii]|nr:hypothetical protein [Nitrospira defluvii]